MNAFQIPTIDLTPYVVGGSTEAQARTAGDVDAACREIGFMQVVGHGIDTTVVEGLAGAIDQLFGLPLEEKRNWIRPAAENRGYTPPRSEELALSAGVQSETRMKDFFEAFNVGSSVADHPGVDLVAAHYAANTWPDLPGFRDAVDAWRAEAGRVARTLVSVFEDALALPRGAVADLARHPIEVLRMNNYALPAGSSVALDEDMIGMGEHTDFGIVTILWADGEKGLQVLHAGRWRDVSPLPGALLINLGDLTTRLTNEAWLSTLHRVKPPVVDGTIRRRRSAAYFFDGDAEAVVGPLAQFVSERSPAIYADVTVDEHVRAKLAGSRAGLLNPAAARESDRLAAARGAE